MPTFQQHYAIRNAKGLHARAATQFVQTANQYESTVTVYRGEAKADGKSVMSLLILAVPCGGQIQVETSGQDAKQSLEALGALVNAGFGE